MSVVNAALAQAHIKELRENGMTWPQMADWAGISQESLRYTLLGSPNKNIPPPRTIRTDKYEAILAVPVPRTQRKPIDAVLPDLSDPDEDWRDDALCAQADPELFYPDKGENATAAKKICEQCAVSRECLDWALSHGEDVGVWGGMSQQERNRLRRRSAA